MPVPCAVLHVRVRHMHHALQLLRNRQLRPSSRQGHNHSLCQADLFSYTPSVNRTYQPEKAYACPCGMGEEEEESSLSSSKPPRGQHIWFQDISDIWPCQCLRTALIAWGTFGGRGILRATGKLLCTCLGRQGGREGGEPETYFYDSFNINHDLAGSMEEELPQGFQEGRQG